MPSRIDIGPEGGPFVAINENSNDLELQDINGNVIAKWDETAGQWDFNSNDLTNVGGIVANNLTAQNSATLGGNLDAGGNSLTNAAAIDTTQARSPSIPTTRIYKDGTDIVAVRDSEISRGTSPATVIHIKSLYLKCNKQRGRVSILY